MIKTALQQKSSNQFAFTLVELLISMTIIAMILGLSVSGYYGLRTTMILKQSAETLKSDILYAKRSSMLVKRKFGENWINGVGIDLASMSMDNPAYRIFKYCGDDDQYHDFAFENIENVVGGDGYIPSDYYGSCESTGVSELVSAPGYVKVSLPSNSLNFTVSTMVRFIFFESPTGEMHLYDCDGSEVLLSDFDSDIFLTYILGSRSYHVGINENGEIDLGIHDFTEGEEIVDVCNNAINIFEEAEEPEPPPPDPY